MTTSLLHVFTELRRSSGFTCLPILNNLFCITDDDDDDDIGDGDDDKVVEERNLSILSTHPTIDHRSNIDMVMNTIHIHIHIQSI